MRSSRPCRKARLPGQQLRIVWLIFNSKTCRNLGLDLVVVVTKTDFMSELEKDFDYKDEHFDFIQQAVRKFCLQYGASLFYTSVKEDKNCDLLYKYLVHRIYNFPFKVRQQKKSLAYITLLNIFVDPGFGGGEGRRVYPSWLGQQQEDRNSL